jgi:ADP-ribosylglycohydrolase
VLAALYCFLKSPADPVESIVRAINMGGDTDTVAAITGAIAGSHNGAAAFPERLAEGLKNADYIAQLGEELCDAKTSAGA